MVKKVLLCIGGVMLLSFTLFIINQTLAVVQLAEKVSPVLGQVVLWGLIVIYGILLLTPVILFFRLPRALAAPEEGTGPEYERYVARLKKRLSGNELLQEACLSGNYDVEKAIQLLDQKVNNIVCRDATRVFMTTAISQYGKLDTIAVLFIQSKMIWEIAHVYYQRFTLRDAIYLYSNVATSAFIANSLNEIDVEEQIEPLVTAATSGILGGIPGMAAIASVFVNSVVTGTTNAFLTLRVGMIAKRYCGLLVMTTPMSIRKVATTEALTLLKPIMGESVKLIGVNIANKAKSTMSDTFSNIKEGASKTTEKLKDKMTLGKSEPAMVDAEQSLDETLFEQEEKKEEESLSEKKQKTFLFRGRSE